MKCQQIVNGLTIITMFVAVLASQARQSHAAEDGVASSFERELNRVPGDAPQATRTDIENDVLYELVNKPLQSVAEPSAVNAESQEQSND